MFNSRFIITTSLLFLSIQSFSASKEVENYLKNAPCNEVVLSSISKSQLNQTWFPIMEAQPYKPMLPGISFRNTLSKKGYKIFHDTQSTTLVEFRLSGEKIAHHTWSKVKGCRLVSTDYKQSHPEYEVSSLTSSNFKDSDLNILLKNNKWGAIYVWSPYMPLSVQAIKEIKNAMTKISGGHLTILVDGKAHPQAIKDLIALGHVTLADSTSVASSELLIRGVGIHYPVLFLYKNGFLLNKTYVGHKTEPIYKIWLEQNLKSLDESLKRITISN